LKSSREVAFQILLEFENTKERLEKLIAINLQKHKISARERKLVYNLSFGVVRHLSLLDWKSSKFFRGNYKKALNKFKIILRLAIYEIDFLKHIPPHATVNEYVKLAKRRLQQQAAPKINGILRNYLREGRGLSPLKKFKYIETQLALEYSFPEWLIKRWLSLWGENETRELCHAFNERPLFDLRINTKKISKQEFLQILQRNGIVYEKSRYYDRIIKVIDIQKIDKLKLFEKGLCSVQDESALLVIDLLNLQEGETILDACAAPGGKYTALLENAAIKIHLTGMDIDNGRLRLLRLNCIRLGFTEYVLVQGDAFRPPFRQKFDKILIDAPCSGLGTIQKNPDIKWRRSYESLFEFQNLQLNLLESLSKLVLPGGELIYSTCTIDPAENEEVVQKFLKNQGGRFEIAPPAKKLPDFISEGKYIRTFPHIHKMDGSFAARVKCY